jgi:signal transduction histidine kinase
MEFDSDNYDPLRVLVAGVAHEMNTPLGVCLTLHSALCDDLKKFKEAYNNEELCEEDIDEHLKATETYFSLLEKNIASAITLTSQLKKMSFIDSNWYECQAFNEIKEIVAAQDFPGVDNIEFKVTGSASEFPIRVPSETISNIINNLINNSVIYGFADGREGVIKIGISDHRDHICIDYADNGSGIQPAIRSRIFDPFFTTGRKLGGVGLGLSIIYTLVCSRLKGSITLNEQQSGCNLIINIPTIIADKN